MLDMLRPRIDEGDVLAGLHHVGAGIAADRAGADKSDFLAHAFLFVVISYGASGVGLSAGGSMPNVFAVMQVIEKLPVVATAATRLSMPRSFSAAA